MPDVQRKCEVCLSLLDEEDLFCANCGTEASQWTNDQAAVRDVARVATHNFECAGCGASMSFDARAGSLRCPFCGCLDLKQEQDRKILSPNRVVPFRVSQADAEIKLRECLGRGFFRPEDLAQRAALVKMTPVYVPYWVFEAKTHTFWTADTSDTPPGSRGDWYPLSGEHHGEHCGLLVGASGALTAAETGKLCPFDLTVGVTPAEVDLDNVTVEQFAVPRKYARPLAKAGLEQAEAETCEASYVPGRVRNVHVNVLVEALSSEPVLLPVWIMAYRYKDQIFRFLVNGQTGRATGAAPVSWLKIGMTALLVIAAGLAAAAIFAGLMSH
ncbi:MAG TPA: hypothetical protein VJL29_13620 [Thermoguttaceae bacterium]|nr:hypothetical protein [Thermoguttaceae bacterium]